MSTDLDRRLRAALQDVADVPAPDFTPAAAVAGARRRRRRQVTALVAGVAAVAAVAVAVPTVALRSDPAPPAAPAPAARALVAGYAYALPGSTGPTDLGDYRVYDRRSGKYVGTPWLTAVPSPDGRLVAVAAADGKMGIVDADRVLDRTAVRWVANRLGSTVPPRISAVWSPDSARVLLDADYSVSLAAGGRFGVRHRAQLVDTRTLTSSVVELGTALAARPVWMGKVIFGPDGRTLALALNFTDRPTGLLVLFDERGRATREVPIGATTVPDQPFSPDGRLVAVHSAIDGFSGSTRVLAADTGAEVGRTDGDVVGWLDDGRYLVRADESLRAVELSSGRVLGEQRLAPDGDELTAVWPAALRGEAPAGAIVM